jgi:hypothetical protein
MTWTPTLVGADADRARATVEAIAAELRGREVTLPSLGYGNAGLAIFHAYRARAGMPGADEDAVVCIERAMGAVAEEAAPWLYMGYAGLGFALQELAPVAGDVEEALGQVDAMIEAELSSSLWTPYELVGGMIGIGVYGAIRGIRPLVDAAVRVLGAAVEDGVWRTYDAPGAKVENPDGHFNLGLAHGIAGAVAFLADAGERDAAGAAIEWLMRHVTPGVIPSVPMTVQDARRRTFTLDGWCYGEPSTAIAFVRSGLACAVPAWIDAGRELALLSARRTEQELAHVSIDTGLCHGATGRAHLFARLAMMLDSDELHGAAAHWHRRALLQLADVATVKDPGFQLGLCGMGLALLAATEPVEPTWDAALLVSAPARAGSDRGSGTSPAS